MRVFAARRGLKVEAMTERMERMIRIESRFHSGQFCIYLVFTLKAIGDLYYQRVIGVVTWLGDKYNGHGSAAIVLHAGVELSIFAWSTDVVIDK